MATDASKGSGETEKGTAEDKGPKLPAPTLPKGGGAIAPIGEKFVSNPQSGTANFSIPIFTSPGRAGFSPSLALSYDAGAGNGPYGLGWSLPVPNIGRRTAKGLPQYNDAAESDVFVLSGAEDLVPGAATSVGDETVVPYRPRVEAAFARIERHVRADGSQYWVSFTRDNIRSVYGFSRAAQIADPTSSSTLGIPNRVFRWMLEWSDDDKGNVIAYVYKPEDDVNVVPSLPEQNRSRTNLYLKAIAYAQPTPRQDRTKPPLDLSAGRAAALSAWPLVVLFDYGDHDRDLPTLAEGDWAARQDPFSTYRSGFEIRTHRLCQRILMVHQFEALGPEPVVVRSTELGHTPTPALTYLTSATQRGWQKTGATYVTKPMPTITMGYGTVGAFDQTSHALDPESARNLPDGLTSAFALMDFYGEGLPGIFSEQTSGWYYKRPEGCDDVGQGHFGPVRRVDSRPSATMGDGFQLQDVNADGLVDLVRMGRKPAGVFERIDDEWQPFWPFPFAPDIDWSDPNLRFVDLDGDGLPDVLITDGDVFRWHRALGRDGFAEELRTAKPLDRLGPMPLFSTQREAVLLADMTGDGLSDVVHVRNGSVSYWPNLGYGRFGARVEMANAPRLDTQDGFDPGRVHVGDIDGTGTADLVYVRTDGVHVFLNQAGNSFAAQPVLRGLPVVHDFAHFSISDLFGTGTACLVWSSALPADRAKPLRWIDPLAGRKPHLLETVDNGFGTRTTIAHAASTKYYLQDRAANRPWITKLPFPVQVVDTVTVEDLVSQTKFVTSYDYHHGFYDGEEREFRGFGMVEQRDTQDLAPFYGSGEFTDGLDQTLHIPPSVVKTWYHTGAFLDGTRVSNAYAREYWAGDPQRPALTDSVLPPGLLPDETRQAFRALRGHVLRQETFAEDESPLAGLPYLVTESNFTVELIQSKGAGSYAVFVVCPRETLELHYERNATDPRIQHGLTLKTSKYGDIVDQVSIAYPRRANAVTPAQSHLWATWGHHEYHDLDALTDDYRVGLPKWETTAELAALTSTGLVSLANATAAIAPAPRPYDPLRRPLRDTPPAEPILIHEVRHYYWDDALTKRLPLNDATPRALSYETLTLALDDRCLQLFQGRAAFGEADNATLVDLVQGGYAYEGGLYWVSSGVVGYQARFFLPISLTSAFNGVSRVDYDLTYALLPIGNADPVGLQSTFEHDWRLLAPSAVTDPNGTRSEVATDVLGIVVGTAIRGAAGEGGPTAAIDYAFFSGPTAPTSAHARTFTAYDVNGPFEESVVYSDGLGRIVSTKVHVKDGPLVDGGATVTPRWVGTGRTVFNNKAKPVKKYESYFAADSKFDSEAGLVKQGVTPIWHYDALTRVIRVDQPNGTFSTVAFDAWSQTTSDENDTVLLSQWCLDRAPTGTATAREKAAALSSVAHAATPKVEHIDPLGRIVLTVLDNKTETHQTLVELDIEGKTLSVTDAEKKPILDQWFDIAGRALKAHSVDAGDTWTLPDAAGQPLFIFRAAGKDGLRIRSVRDLARRVTHGWVLNDGRPLTDEALRERVVYGPATAGPALAHGRVLAELDGAGLQSFTYDFRGNVIQTDRRVVLDYRLEPDWVALKDYDGIAPLPPLIDSTLESPLSTSTEFDGKSRPVHQTTPDSSVTTWTYDVSGLLASLATKLGRRAPGPNQTETFVSGIEYDAKGRRKNIQFGNGIETTYQYDSQTFRLTSIKSAGAGSTQQDLSYVYDPVGNITSIADASQPTICFAGQLVAAESTYVYDPTYRLTHATGREHPNQAGIDQRDVPTPLPLPTDCQALANYFEDYLYDNVGNIKSLSHTTILPTGPHTVSRTYTYDGVSNRLQKTTIGLDDSPYGYIDRGCMKSMAHLDLMLSNHRDQLIAATRTRVGNGPSVQPFAKIANPVFFGYDLRGQRVRKVSESNGKIADRIYFGPYELYRERASMAAPPTVQRETVHAFDDRTRVALVETLTDGSEELVRYQLSNHLSSSSVELDRSGVVISYEEFHPYGTTAVFVGLASKRYRHTAMERDEETGLCQMGVRSYAAWLGRWTSSDPAGLVDGSCLFAFVSNNPIRYRDPRGREKKEPDTKKAEYQAKFIAGVKEASVAIHAKHTGPFVRPFDTKRGKFDSNFWERSQIGDVSGKTHIVVEDNLSLRKGKSAAAAIDAIIKSPEKWTFDCATFVQVVELYGILKALGPVDFDKFIAGRAAQQQQPLGNNVLLREHESTGLQIKDLWEHRQVDVPSSRFEKVEGTKRSAVKGGPDGLVATLGPGTELDYQSLALAQSKNLAHHNDPFRFENVVKVGPDQYIAFPFGTLSDQEIRETMSDTAINKGLKSSPQNVRIETVQQFGYPW